MHEFKNVVVLCIYLVNLSEGIIENSILHTKRSFRGIMKVCRIEVESDGDFIKFERSKERVRQNTIILLFQGGAVPNGMAMRSGDNIVTVRVW